jgi:hypothetical protein
MKAPRVHTRMITDSAVFGTLSLLNTVYLVYALKLIQKQFHVMMYLILQVSYTCYILSYIFYDRGNFEVYAYLLCPYWFLENLAHFIFVIKLWIIAHKLREINTGTRDEYLRYKLGTIIAVQIIFMVVGTVFIPL